MDITKIDVIDYIGFNGPDIIKVLTFIQLLDQIPYLIGFVVFYYINKNVNELLKNTIRENRPEKIDLIKEQKKDFLTTLFYSESNLPKISSVHNYGMPSGHAQTSSFALGYLFFVKNIYKKSIKTPNFLFLFEFCILLITLFQRWNDNKHTIKQLIIGCIVGFTISYLAYISVKYLLKMNTKAVHSNDFMNFMYKFYYSPATRI